MIQDAAAKDVQVVAPPAPKDKDGKYEVLFPVCLPDEGTFDWLDMFLEKNPEYCELSDRKILEWAEKSGIWRNKGYSWKASNDKPDMNFGIAQMDDFSIRQILHTVAQAHHRNFVYMEVKSNLIKDDRRAALKKFSAPHFKKVAQVMMGEPMRDFKEKVHSLLLKEKQDRADMEFKQRKVEESRKRLFEKEQKDAERERKRVERAAKKAHEAALKVEEERRAAEAKLAEGQNPEQGDAQMADNETRKEDEKAPEAEDDEDDDGGEEDKKDAELEEPPQ